MPESWIARVSTTALGNFDQVMAWLGLEGGRHQGREYLPRNPKREDRSPGSFAINRDTGAWLDGATGDAGGDLVALVAYLHDVRQGEAADRLGRHLGLQPPAPRKRAPGRSATPDGAETSATPEKSHGGPVSPATGPNTSPASKPGEASGPAPVPPTEHFVMPVPDEAPAHPTAHPRLGKPARVWEYRDGAGRLLFLVARFETATGKEIRPLSLRRLPTGTLVWRWLGVEPLRPLYGLDRLAQRPAAPVLIAEGEKAADAGGELFPDYVAMASPNGAKAADKADWSPLAGRRCLVWADADPAGNAYAAEVCRCLQAAGAGEVIRLDTSLFLQIPDGATRGALPEGWDAADAIGEGYGPAWVAARLAECPEALRPAGAGREGLRGETSGGAGTDALATPEESNSGLDSAAAGANPDASAPPGGKAPPEGPVGPRFELTDRGVDYVGTDKEGNPQRPRRVCGPLEILALVRDQSGDAAWGKLVSFENHDGETRERVILDQWLSGDGTEIERKFRDWGLYVAPGARARLVEYLITTRCRQRARTTARPGWHDGVAGPVFVLPGGRSFGDAGEYWRMEDDSAVADYRERGDLEEWKRHVAALCIGNSRLVFAVCLAFAAPLLRLIGGESGGYHLSGESGDGKTTCLRVASSVCGGPDYMRTWRSSDNSIEYLAVQHCDSLLPMDELHQANAKTLGDSIYMMGNSSGKNRSRAQGGLRETPKWRILFLSSGEAGVAARLAAVGMEATAGMEGRMAEIPARVSDAPPGIYEDLHGEPTPKALSMRLAQAVGRYHGTALPAFLGRLVAEDAEEIRTELAKARKAFADRFVRDAAGNQVMRVADRCALAGAAGELATAWGITGWPAGEAFRQAGACFHAWVDQRGGEGNAEERAMLLQVRGFLERHGEARFSDWRRSVAKDTHANRVINRAGWRRLTDKETGRIVDPPEDGGLLTDDTVTEYLILPQVFKEEVCRNFNPRTVAKLLAARGCLRTESDGRPDPKIKPPGEAHQRMYHILSALFDMD